MAEANRFPRETEFPPATLEGLAYHAGVFGVAADQAPAEQESVAQGRAAEPPARPVPGQALARQAQRVPDRGAQNDTGQFVRSVIHGVPG